jgi:hypothetical protein
VGLETTTYIDGLVSTNPTAGDPVSQGDDHVRLIKAAVLATFPNVTGAVTPTHTELNYVDGVTSAIQTQINTHTTNITQATLTSGTAVATTSGTSIDFTGIPSWVKKITVSFSGVSTNGTSLPMILLGDAGGVETTTYTAAATTMSTAGNASFSTSAGFVLAGGWAASSVLSGACTLSLLDAATNLWVLSCTGTFSDTTANALAAGSKALSATLDRVRLTTVGGVNTFDAGSVNILYE